MYRRRCVIIVGAVVLIDSRGDTVREHFQEFFAKLISVNFAAVRHDFGENIRADLIASNAEAPRRISSIASARATNARVSASAILTFAVATTVAMDFLRSVTLPSSPDSA